MTATVTAELSNALRQARLARHHPDCRCGIYRDAPEPMRGAPYCTPAEWRWESMLDRLITKALDETEQQC